MIGYHGTTKENAEQIVKSQHFYDSDSDHEWLGRGVYFFSFKGHAQWWNDIRFRRGETEILRAHLVYERWQLWDLDDPEKLDALDRIMDTYLRAGESAGSKDPRLRTAANLDTVEKRECFACNLLKDQFPAIGILAHTFTPWPWKVQTHPSGFKRAQRQICVSDHSIIKKIEII